MTVTWVSHETFPYSYHYLGMFYGEGEGVGVSNTAKPLSEGHLNTVTSFQQDTIGLSHLCSLTEILLPTECQIIEVPLYTNALKCCTQIPRSVVHKFPEVLYTNSPKCCTQIPRSVVHKFPECFMKVIIVWVKHTLVSSTGQALNTHLPTHTMWFCMCHLPIT